MTDWFELVLNQSAKGSLVILIVILLRIVMRRAPKSQRVWLWGIAGLSLILPIWFQNPLSLQPSSVPVSHTVNAVLDSARENPQAHPFAAALVPAHQMSSMSVMDYVWLYAAFVWIIGIFAMLLYLLVSAVRLHFVVRGTLPVPNEKRVYTGKSIRIPFISGVLIPRIYLPDDLAEPARTAVLQHERAHLRHGDHLWKMLGFLVLTVHWFNPLVWLAYVLLARDIELACDERVIRKMDCDAKKSYSNALLDCSLPKRMIPACPLAFGEVAVKTRIESVLNYRKPAVWMTLLGMCSIVGTPFFFASDPSAYRMTDDSYIKMAVLEETPPAAFQNHNIRVCSYQILRHEYGAPQDRRNLNYFYVAAMVREYGDVNGTYECVGETFAPMFLYFKGDWYCGGADLTGQGIRQQAALDRMLRVMAENMPDTDPNGDAWKAYHDALAADCDAQAAKSSD